MARLRTHKRKNGKPDSYSVEWLIGGRRDATESGYETFDPLEGPKRNLAHAKMFLEAVRAAGHQWPENYLPKYGFTDPITYQRALDEARAEQEATDGAAAPAVTLADYAEKWVARRAKDPSFGQVRKDRQYLRDYILPAFGDRDLLDPLSITKAEIQDWALDLRVGEKAEPDSEDVQEAPDYEEEYDEEDEELDDAQEDEDGIEWVRRPLSPKTIRNIVAGTFSALLTHAVNDTDLPARIANPCSRVALPKLDDDEGDEEMVSLDPEQFALLLGCMKDDAKDLTLFLYGTGLRFSEATALKVKDFLHLDPEHPSFWVRRAWKQRASNGAWYIGRPKSKKSKRQLALTPSQAAMITELIAGRGKEELVFTGPRGGRLTHSTYYSQRWRHAVYQAMRCDACRAKDWEAGIGRRGGRELTNENAVWCGHAGALEDRPRPHDLRHSHVALLILKGTHIKKIQQRLGHASIQVTMDRYGHLFPETDVQLVVDLEDMLTRVSTAPTTMSLVGART